MTGNTTYLNSPISNLATNSRRPNDPSVVEESVDAVEDIAGEV